MLIFSHSEFVDILETFPDHCGVNSYIIKDTTYFPARIASKILIFRDICKYEYKKTLSLIEI